MVQETRRTKVAIARVSERPADQQLLQQVAAKSPQPAETVSAEEIARYRSSFIATVENYDAKPMKAPERQVNRALHRLESQAVATARAAAASGEDPRLPPSRRDDGWL